MSELFPTKTIAIEVLSCTDANRVREFNRWYDKIHIPELRDIPGIVDVYRYLDIQGDFGELGTRFMAPKGSPARYLTIYRINSEDPWDVMRRVKEDDEKRAAEGKVMDCMESYEITVWDFLAYRRTVQLLARPETRLPDGMPETILLVFGGIDPTKKLEHDDWWLYTHAHDLLEVPGLIQCERFRTLNPEPAEDDATVLNIYEFDVDDPVATFRRILEDDVKVRRVQGRFSPFSRPAKPHASGLYQHWDLM